MYPGFRIKGGGHAGTRIKGFDRRRGGRRGRTGVRGEAADVHISQMELRSERRRL